MAGAPLEGMLDAIAAIVHRLDARDSFGLVAFAADAGVVVPAGPLTDMDEVVDRLARVQPDGPSDLAAGYRLGVAEVSRVAEGAGGTVLIVSDGRTGHDLLDGERLEGLARTAHADGIVTSTLTYGGGREETLLTALARAGSGNHHVADSAATASAAIASEVADLLARSVQSVSLTVRLEDAVELVGHDADLPLDRGPGGTFAVELGDLYFEEQRRLALRLRAGRPGAPAPRSLGSVELRYAELPSLVEQQVVLPLVLEDSTDEAASPERAEWAGGAAAFTPASWDL
jgi:Ca-activated chloride channel family protein